MNYWMDILGRKLSKEKAPTLMSGWGSGAAVATIAASVKIVSAHDNAEHVVERHRYRNYGDNNKTDNEFGWDFA